LILADEYRKKFTPFEIGAGCLIACIPDASYVCAAILDLSMEKKNVKIRISNFLGTSISKSFGQVHLKGPLNLTSNPTLLSRQYLKFPRTGECKNRSH
jgi:hypothetical protein